jgi:hypothetical protein
MTCLGERSRYTLNQWAAQDERRSRELGFARGRVVLMAITLRTLADSDLDTLFVWESDPRAVQMAAFTRADPSDRTAFDAHHERIRNDPSCTLRAIDDDGEFVGDRRQLHDGRRTGGHLLDRTCAMGARPGVAGAPCVPCDRADPAAIRSCGASQCRVSEGACSGGFRRGGPRNGVRARSRRRDRRAHLPARPLGG